MKIGLPAHLTFISGRPGTELTVYAKTKAGPIMRAFSLPANPNSAMQQQVRTALATVTAAWKNLTQVQRDAWETFAGREVHKDRFGTVVEWNGINAYVQINMARITYLNAAQVSDPTTITETQPAPITGITGVGVAGDTWSVTPTHGINPVTGLKLVTKVAAVVSAGRKAQPNDYRSISGVDADSCLNLPATGNPADYTRAGVSEPPTGTEYDFECFIVSPNGLRSMSFFKRVAILVV